MTNVSKQPVKGQRKQIFGVWFTYTGSCWLLDEVLDNPITKKNVGSKGLYLNKNAKTHAFIDKQL